jgi:GT2 family glycosyltransferase
MENKKETVCAIVVTYNRKKLLKECLDAILAQTHPLDSIIVIDNASTDGTPEFLKENGYLKNKKIDYVRLSENNGGAGGFHEGVKRGYEKGFDWLWLMDDDVRADYECLKIIMNFRDKIKVIVPTRISIDLKLEEFAAVKYNLKNPFILDSREVSIIDKYKIFDNLPSSVFVEDFSFEGPLIHKSIVEKIGYPKKDFFIFADDTDYSFKIRYGIKEKILLVRDAKIIRMVSLNKISKEVTWKDYYFWRNVAYIHYKYGENFLVKYKPFLFFSGMILKDLLKFNFNYKKFKVIFYVLSDYRKNVLPRRYLPESKL